MYKELYYYLFNQISDMIEQLQEIQQTAEEMYIAQEADRKEEASGISV